MSDLKGTKSRNFELPLNFCLQNIVSVIHPQLQHIEHLPYVCQFLVYPLLLQLSRSCISEVRDERNQTCTRSISRAPVLLVLAHVPRIVGTLPEVFRLKSPPPPAPDAIFADTDVERLWGGRFPPGRYPDKTTTVKIYGD